MSGSTPWRRKEHGIDRWSSVMFGKMCEVVMHKGNAFGHTIDTSIVPEKKGCKNDRAMLPIALYNWDVVLTSFLQRDIRRWSYLYSWSCAYSWSLRAIKHMFCWRSSHPPFIHSTTIKKIHAFSYSIYISKIWKWRRSVLSWLLPSWLLRRLQRWLWTVLSF